MIRTNKVGVARQIDKMTKPMTARKMSTSSRGSLPTTARSNDDKEAKYTRKELKEFRQMFDMFDTDKSGAIGGEELKQAMKSMGVHLNEGDVDNLIKEVDADGNGEIDFEEFCGCMKKSQDILRGNTDELVRECFEIFDQDRNGIITENEFKYIAKEFGEFNDELAEKVFRELDVSANGHISADQFTTIVEDYLFSEPWSKSEETQVQHIHEMQEESREVTPMPMNSDDKSMLTAAEIV